MENKRERVQHLEEIIIKYKKYYYGGSPLISDDKYDELEDELRKLSPSSHVLDMVGSTVKGSNKIKHDKKMLSLEKRYDFDDLVKWLDGREVVGTKKIDGISCSIIYENGRLVLCKTRGNGSFGEEITEKCRWINSIPKTIINKDLIEVRGEIYCSYSNFNDLKNEMIEMGEEIPSSPRNIVAGFMGRKEKIFLCQYLDFQAFDFIPKGKFFGKELEVFRFFEQEGFLSPDYTLITNQDELKTFLDNAKCFINDGTYQIDGVVFTLNEIKLHQVLGETSHHPKYKLAFKFKSEYKSAKIISIDWNISRNGVFTPVAIIEPTEISGALVSRVTLHNFGNAKSHNLKTGDTIKIIRSGEVIPKFEEVISSSSGRFEYPKNCSYCNQKLNINDIRLVCANANCIGKMKYEVLNYIDKIGIEDLSEKRLAPLIEMGLVKRIDDLYRLKKSDLLKLPKTKETLASKLLKSIDNSKTVSLATFLSALGLPGGALNKCEKIVESGFDSIQKILEMKLTDIVKIDGFAEKSGKEIIDGISFRSTLIENLCKLGVRFDEAPDGDENKSKKLKGLTICITGKLENSRAQIQEMIKANGGVCSTSVSKNTDILICNDKNSSSSKMKNAIKNDVKIMSEEEFYYLL